MWFRSDLRASDNRALLAAGEAPPTSALYIATPGQWRRHDWGENRVRFTARTVAALAQELATIGIPLHVGQVDGFAGVPAIVAAAARETGASAVFANHEVGVNEARRDAATATALRAGGHELRLFHDDTLLVPGSVRTGADRPYTVFTPFMKAALRAIAQSPVRALGRPRAQLEGLAAARIDPAAFGVAGPDPLESRWPAGERAARARLERFISRGLDRYHEGRDRPSLDGTSGLSPYLAVGAISARRCLAGVIGGGDPTDAPAGGPSTWIAELLWREFFRHLFHAFPRLSMHRAFRPETETLAWRDDPGGLEAWKAGRTGIPFVDAGMRELLATGWMHNRLRMVTAMYLSKNLLIDWREGERHFMRHLVDADLAQNNSGWQWASSTGTDAAPYFRIFNPIAQGRRFDAGGEYIRRFVPELATLGPDDIHEPPALALGGLGYPAPIVDLGASRARAIAAFKALR